MREPRVVDPGWAAEIAPTCEGPAGRAWAMVPDPGMDPNDPTRKTGVATWVLHVPGAHPFWSWWFLACVNLRPVDGMPPAHKQFPEAEYELLVIAQSPDEPPPHPHRLGVDPLHHLTPVDQCHQFEALPGGDDKAREIVGLFVAAVVAGKLSPDHDHRARWARFVRGTVKHYIEGRH